MALAKVPYVLNDEPVHGEDWDFFSRLSVNVLALEAIVHPGFADKVHSLSYVEASGKTCMVGSRERENELPWSLKCLINFNLINYCQLFILFKRQDKLEKSWL